MDNLNTLIENFYVQLENVTKDIKTSNRIKRPECVKRDRKSFIDNFEEICTNISRNPHDVSVWIAKELHASTSISANGVLVIHNMFTQMQLESIIKQYVSIFVQCPLCKSCNTQLYKINRICFLICDKCRAKTSINN